MQSVKLLSSLFLLALILTVSAKEGLGQRKRSPPDQEFGPVVRAYLGYLRNEQEVVDDRASRREINPVYYRHNSNRIRALRQMAMRIARESGNDYLPELEAVTRDELGRLFEVPPPPTGFRVGEILADTFRFLGLVRSGEAFFIFARLDPYEQAQRQPRAGAGFSGTPPASNESTSKGSTNVRARRVSSP